MYYGMSWEEDNYKSRYRYHLLWVHISGKVCNKYCFYGGQFWGCTIHELADVINGTIFKVIFPFPALKNPQIWDVQRR
jgi:hypothetical protein